MISSGVVPGNYEMSVDQFLYYYIIEWSLCVCPVLAC